MITFLISLVALVLGYVVYGRFVERVFAPDDRMTPAVAKADGLDYVAMPYWKVFMIQFLNIAGTGPIFGAIMGAKFGPAAYLWIVFGCIFAGATHDYLSGMLSMRHGGCDLPTLVQKFLGGLASKVLLVFIVLLLVMVGAVFVYSPAEILVNIGGQQTDVDRPDLRLLHHRHDAAYRQDYRQGLSALLFLVALYGGGVDGRVVHQVARAP